MNRKYFYTAVIILSFLVIGIQQTSGVIYLSNSGWSQSVGTWDDSTKTGTLTQDVFETIEITDNGITLDGGGFTVNIGGSLSTGVDLSGRQYVTVQNINVVNDYVAYEYVGTGITLNPSGYCNVIDNTISGCLYGIVMDTAGTNTIDGNVISNNKEYGIVMQDGSVYNTLTNNTVKDNNFGSFSAGLSITSGSHSNEIYNNNFIDNSLHAVVYQPGNVFTLSLPIGGNYWSGYTTPDSDGDNIVDDPYPIPYGGLAQDYLPWVVQDGWATPTPPPTPEEAIFDLIDTVETMNLHHGIENSLDAKLDAALNALDDLNENNYVAAINSLNAFINAVEAQRGKKVTNEQADILVDDAQYIIDLILAE